jgi:hypothetical protein
MAEVDREMLVDFLIDLRDFVYKLFDTYNEIFGEAGALGRRTWDGLEPNHWALIAMLRGQELQSWPGPGERPTYDLDTLDRELAERGLTGTPLEFKLNGFYRARDEWEQWQAAPPVVTKRNRRLRVVDWFRRLPAPPGPVRQGLAIAKRGLKWGDVGLITLASFVHVGEPIKEAKEGVEALLEDSLALSDRQLEQTPVFSLPSASA